VSDRELLILVQGEYADCKNYEKRTDDSHRDIRTLAWDVLGSHDSALTPHLKADHCPGAHNHKASQDNQKKYSGYYFHLLSIAFYELTIWDDVNPKGLPFVRDIKSLIQAKVEPKYQ
jgi:hypothetical protein